MPFDRGRRRLASSVAMAEAFIRSARDARSLSDLGSLMEAVAHEMGFRHYALIHHDDLRQPTAGVVDLKNYPAAITDRLVRQGRFRRDPVIRGCHFAGRAFLWSELDRFIQLDRVDQESLAIGRREGLNMGITVPSQILGERMGSCTFAGARRPERVRYFLGPVQMMGPFAFQAARRLTGASHRPVPAPRLQPRHRDCIILAGRGYSNKMIARALGITPRTVDGYMTEAREILGAHDRAELLVRAVLAGEIDAGELGRSDG